MDRKTFKIATLGCRTNQYESQAYRDQLVGLGYEEAGAGDEADLCIVNTCTVTASADSTSRNEIRKLARSNKQGQVVVTGCLANDALLELGEGIRIIPNSRKEDLVAELFPEEEIPEFAIKRFEGHTRAFVKVQDGCNSFCTYCIIPYVRGRSRSRTIADVVKEVEGLIASGYKEVVITGINVGDFEDEEKRLADLIREVDAIDGLQRLRLSSIDPDEVDGALQDAILEGKHTCKSLHIVLQAGSNTTLKRMNRKYTRQIFLDTVHRLKKLAPTFTFTTDVIVGFPGETEADFEETLAIMSEVKFAKVHMFPYSARKRTKAALYPDQIPESIIKERKAKVLIHAEKTAFLLREEYVGSHAEVLVENNNCGHTDNFLPVTIEGPILLANSLVKVLLTKNTPEGLVGIPTT